MLKEVVLLLVQPNVGKRQTKLGIVVVAEILNMVARRLLGDMAGKRGFRDIERSPLGIMVTSNTGPNALGIIFRGAPRA